MKHLIEKFRDIIRDAPTLHHVGGKTRIGTLQERHVANVWSINIYEWIGNVVINGRQYQVRPGYISLMPPGTERIMYFSGVSPHRSCHFTPQLDSNELIMPIMFYSGNSFGEFCRRFDLATSLFNKDPVRSKAIIWDLLLQLSEFEQVIDESQLLLPGHLRTAIKYIENNLNRHLTVQTLANYVELTPVHLTRLFKQYFDMSTSSYIHERRIIMASELLIDTDHAIKRIAVECGIPDPHQFNKFFRKQLGISPLKFRKNKTLKDIPWVRNY